MVRRGRRGQVASPAASCKPSRLTGCLTHTTWTNRVPTRTVANGQPEARPPHAPQVAVRHLRGGAVLGSGHRRERRDLLDVRPAVAATAAGARSGTLGESRYGWSRT